MATTKETPSTPPTTAAPASSEIDISKYTPVTEGKATILFPKGNEVFYNPVQEFNRDMSIAAIRTWSEIFLGEKRARIEKKIQNAKDEKKKEEAEKHLKNYIDTQSFTILEALAASGLRSIRYAKEIPHLKQVVANDLEADAVESIKRNIKYNELTEELVRPNQGDAMQVMYSAIGNAQKYDVVDLDPYGAAAPFIDGAVQAVSEGGLLCVTCTDLAILTGSMHPETCFGKYNGMPLKGMFPHEMALRLVLNTLQTSAGRYKRHIVPLMSCSIDFYLRVFVRVYTSPQGVKKAASKTAIMYECSGCHSYAVQPLGKIQIKDNGNERHVPGTGPPVDEHCRNCGNTHHVGGPAWGAPLHDKEFVNKMLEHVKENESNYGTHTRMKGMLSVISEELDTPLYWTLQRLCGTIHCTSIPLQDLNSAILNAGYKVSGSHCGPATIKTDAPSHILWDILRAFVKKHPVTMANIAENSPARAILAKEPSIEVNFKRHPDAVPKSQSIKLVRYQINPTANWGPKARAGGKKRKAEQE
ncbi:N2,N2-dimethylguanosine tRNA methyltransferase [Phascolomyces articulosus]|uniref:tRNA (guanine(26)-N(2))-dimethyltransferase n=1 Tax=Phascolomyces articulosus TaxID=60185 RepID=A0AAD5JR78_9FUNG|nr:N2,N2-dimethylguanosine tRNA methyltransferase [Phascolomyces articulosus]